MTGTKRSHRLQPHRRPFLRRKRLRLRPRLLIGAFIILFSATSLALGADPTRAQSPSGGTASDETQASFPKALGEPRSVLVAPALGAVSDSISIEVPPGRRNVQPQLTLTYSSMAGWGDLGLGWQIEIGRVERWRGDGTPTVGDPDTFSYSLAGAGGELRDTGGGVYRARLESLYRDFRRVGDGWVMYNGEGALHRFGGTPESRIDGQLWLLDLVQDPSGNTITYSYDRVGGVLYPKEIRYTGYAPTGDLGANRVLFEYQDRPDQRLFYRYSVLHEQTRRLHRISVFAGESLVRRYEFEYETSPINEQSLLERIVLVGADDSSRITLRTLEYGTRALGWNGGTVIGNIPFPLVDSEGRETGTRVLDVNGDGFADVLGNGQGVYLGDGQGYFAWDESWSTSLAAVGIQFVQPDGDYQGGDKGVSLLDVNTDGLPDLFIASPFWGRRTEIWLNTGAGWALSWQWTQSLQNLEQEAEAFFSSYFLDLPTDCSPPHCGGVYGDFAGCTPADALHPPDCDPENPEAGQTCLPAHCESAPLCRPWVDGCQLMAAPLTLVDSSYDSMGVQFADVNGDGRLDILWSMGRTERLYWFTWLGALLGRIPLGVRGAFLNTGTGWEKNDDLTAALWSIPDFVENTEVQGYDVMDVNGDGLADILRTFEGAQQVRLGTGEDWIEEDAYSNSLRENNIVSLNADRVGQGLRPIDFDDDGLIDYLRANETVTQAYRNTGRGWEQSPKMAAILGSLGIAFSTSDGKATGVTLADVDGDGLSDLLQADDHIRLSASLRDGLLTKATSALGEVTELEWTPSTRFDNRKDDGVEGLPGPMPVVTKLSRYDGRDNTYETAFKYRGGLFLDRQFRGFAWSQQLLPSGVKVETWHHQEEGLTGQFYQEEGYDSQGQLRTRRTSVYEFAPATPPVQQIRLIQSDVEAIDLGWTRLSRTTYTHDERLNIVQVWREPDLDVSGDETTTFFSWVYNEQAGIWSLPARSSVLQGDGGPVLSELVMLYDNLPEGQAVKGLPSQTLSLVRGRESWEEGIYVDKSMGYDNYGNIVSLEDEEGNVTTFQYDEPTSTFRTEAVDPEGRMVRSEYDPRFGTLLWDMDAGGNVTRQEYDAFGRLVKVTLPGDEQSPFGTRTYEYSPLGDAQAQWVHLRETETPNESGTLDTTQFFDGLGRLYRVEKEGTGGQSIVALTEYDDADNPVATSRPFFIGDPPLWTEIERDEMHRPIRVVEPDGGALTLSYAGARVDVVDRRGSQTSFFYNADGNTTEIHQWIGGAKQVTRYHYDALGRLTTIVDALGEETRIAYDALGRRVRFEDPNAGAFQYRYDGEGRLVEQTGADGQTTHFRYNRAGDLLRKEFPDGTVHEFTYDAAGNLVRINDAAGVVDIVYDARGNVVERRRTVLGRTYLTGYAYDSLDRLQRLTYPDGFAVNYEYDSGGNLARLMDNQGRMVAESTEHNAAGQLTELGFGNGDHSTFTYDELLRMTTIRTRSGAGETLQSLDYAYDPGGNILSITESAFGASQAFEYDALGRLTQAVGAYGEEIYEYDAIGNLLRKGSLLFTVDPDHPQRVICGVDLASGPGNATGIGNNPHANPCDDLPQADSQQPSQNKNRTSGPENNPNIARSFQLAYDERGNVIEKGGMNYEYDAENHLVRVRDAKGKVLAENVYDAAGQRVIQRTPEGTTIWIDGLYEETKTHAARHVQAGPLLVATVMTPLSTVQLISEIPTGGWEGALGAIGDWNPTLMTLTGLVGLALVLVPGRGWVRLSAMVLNLAHTVGWHRWGKAAVSLLVLLTILHAITPPAVAAQASLAQPHSEKRYYYHSNHLGSTNVVTDDRGKVVERRDYKPYGDRFDWTGPNSGPRQLLLTFDGQRYDDATGLYYFGARHYDPEIGRFLTADTQVPDPMNPKSLHRYAFVEGNPIRYSDPTGHFTFRFWTKEFWTSENWATLGALIGLGLLVLFLPMFSVLWFAGAGALGFAIFASARGLSAISADFWLSVAAGAIIGAAIGAALAALPASIGITPGLGAVAGFFVGLAADVLVGAVLGGLGPVVTHLAQGGGPEELLTEELGLTIATSALKGAILGFTFGLVLNPMAVLGTFGAVTGGLVTALITLEGLWELGLSAAHPGKYGTLLYLFGYDENWFRNSPAKRLGLPSWAFEGTWIYMGRSEASALLQTMPLAP